MERYKVFEKYVRNLRRDQRGTTRAARVRTMTPFTYIFLRKDMKPVYHIIQAAHAAQEAGIAFGKPEGEIPIHLGLFEVKNQAELFKTAEVLEKLGIRFKMFYEPDDETGYTAIATEPIFSKQREAINEALKPKMFRV